MICLLEKQIWVNLLLKLVPSKCKTQSLREKRPTGVLFTGSEDRNSSVFKTVSYVSTHESH